MTAMVITEDVEACLQRFQWLSGHISWRPFHFCMESLLQTSIFYLNITVTSLWARWRLKSPASRLFTQPFIQAQIKETSKLCVTGLCAGNSPVTGEFPHKWPVTRKMLQFDDVIMAVYDMAYLIQHTYVYQIMSRREFQRNREVLGIFKRGFDCMIFHRVQVTHLCFKTMLSLVQPVICCISSVYFVDLNIRNKFQWKFDENSAILTQENELESVCILSLTSKLNFSSNLEKSCLPITCFPAIELFWKFCTEHDLYYHRAKLQYNLTTETAVV